MAATTPMGFRYPGALPENVAELLVLASLEVIWVPHRYVNGGRARDTGRWRIMRPNGYYWSLDRDATYEDWARSIGAVLDEDKAQLDAKLIYR